MKKQKLLAWILSMTMMISSFGSISAMAQIEPTNSLLIATKSDKIISLTQDMVNENGFVVIEQGVWEYILIPKGLEVKKIVLKEVQINQLLLESGTDYIVEVEDSDVVKLSILEPELEVVDYKKISQMLQEGIEASVVAQLYRDYLAQKQNFAKVYPKLVTKGETKVTSIVISSNIKLDLEQGQVENVTIDCDGSEDWVKVEVSKYNGTISINQSLNETKNNLLRLDLKDSKLEQLNISSEKGTKCSINSNKSSKVSRVEVEGNPFVNLIVETEKLYLNENTKDAFISIYSNVNDIIVEGDNNEISISNSAKINNAIVEGNSIAIYGNGKLENADIIGKEANVSVEGTVVTGENNSTPPIFLQPTSTPKPTATSTPKPTATSTPTPTATSTPTPTATSTPKPTATSTPKPTATSTPTPTATSTPIPTATSTPKPTATSTPKPTATSTPKPTATSTPKPTATSTPKPTATNTPKPTATNTPKPTATSTPKPTATSTPKPTATSTPKPTATSTPKPTATSTPKPTATSTPKPTATNTPTPTATSTPKPTATNTPKPTATSTPKPTATSTPKPTATSTPKPTATSMMTPVPTKAVIKPIVKPISTATPTPTPTSMPKPVVIQKPIVKPMLTTTPTPIPTYNPQTSWVSEQVYEEEKEQYNIFLGTSGDNIFMGNTMQVGQSIDLNFYGVKNWAKDKYTYKWTSSDESIATVNRAGVVTMHSAGIAIISLELINKQTGDVLKVAPVEVGVPQAEYNVFIRPSKNDSDLRKKLSVGNQMDLNFYGVENYKKEDYEYEWISSDTTIATVDSKGMVTAVSSGKVVIRLKLFNKKTKEYLTVSPMVIYIPEKKK